MSAGFNHEFGEQASVIAGQLFAAHTRNDWGVMDPEDAQMNKDVIQTGEGRLMSVYDVAGTKVWVISYVQSNPKYQSDPDYCNTCAMLPSDY